MFIITDLFIGWRDGTLGRARFLVCALIVAALTGISLWTAFNTPYSEHPFLLQWVFWLTLLCSYYCGFLAVIKRLRELVAYPVVWATVWWGGMIIVQRSPWYFESQSLQIGVALICLLVFGLLFCARARR